MVNAFYARWNNIKLSSNEKAFYIGLYLWYLYWGSRHNDKRVLSRRTTILSPMRNAQRYFTKHLHSAAKTEIGGRLNVGGIFYEVQWPSHCLSADEFVPLLSARLNPPWRDLFTLAFKSDILLYGFLHNFRGMYLKVWNFTLISKANIWRFTWKEFFILNCLRVNVFISFFVSSLWIKKILHHYFLGPKSFDFPLNMHWSHEGKQSSLYWYEINTEIFCIFTTQFEFFKNKIK